MLFNTLEFAIFLPIVFLLYWLVFKQRKQQNTLLLVASYFFYGWWDWRFLGLMLASSCIDFFIAQFLKKSNVDRERKLLLALSLLVNLGILGYFKYYNFFLESFVDAFRLFGTELNVQTLKIILPVGISFYTFQTLSYSIDVYRRKLEPAKNWIDFFAFVSFFPQLVAGPIERASNLLPQFKTNRRFDSELATDGLRQILWGLFKKMVIADNCATIANACFAQGAEMGSVDFLIGALAFTFQIYGDFSGYSDIAIGVAKLFGFRLMTNFRYPYFARDMAEFWRRWHISLSTWFRDYLYIPLGGSKGGVNMKIRNTFIIFLVSGFWHGANWTFLVWGGLNALYFLPLLLTKNNRNNLDTVAMNRSLPSVKELAQMLSTFLLAVLAWVFFRAENITAAFQYLVHIFEGDLNKDITQFNSGLFLMVTLLLVVEWINRQEEHALTVLPKIKWMRWIFYLLLAWIIYSLKGSVQDFIYFQF